MKDSVGKCLQIRHRRVFPDAHAQYQSLLLAVFRDQPDSVLDRVLRMPNADGLPEDLNRAAVQRVRPENHAGRFRAPRTDQSGKP